MTTGGGIPAFARGLCDDAAVFPPGLMPLPDAVPGHFRHESSGYAAMIGPLVVAASELPHLGIVLGTGRTLDIAVTAPAGPDQLGPALATAAGLPVRLRALEVAMPPVLSPREFFAELEAVRAKAGDATIFVEIPRDDRRREVIETCGSAGYQAKFRTGGVRAGLYPGEAELAEAIRTALGAGIAFKATAGLHHAVRNTDPETGFEQHGFLNLLLATDAALRDEPVEPRLAERDDVAVAQWVAGLGAERVDRVRERFLSFGTCDIIGPLTELIALDLVPAEVQHDEGATS
jgi:hypothetical protein